MTNKMDKETAYRSYRQYEKLVEEEVKSGALPRERARTYLSEARKNYQNLNLNRELERL